MGKTNFDPQALYDAVDAQRREREMTWAALSKELGISTSTIKSMTKRRWGIELDGVIGLARWVGRTVESFAGGDGGPPPRPTSYAETGRFLRFDTAALYVALNAERERRGMTWEQVAAEIWPSGPWGQDLFKRMAKGGRSEVFSALAICEWLGRTIQSFEHETMF
ncbi:MAG TPA: hypothetical protein VEW48_24595 [Thermoanaerobaculia bacterium]|nr:hypothetical protein [Thermoanaerobaculia bacterium]